MVLCVKWSPNGDMLASTSTDQTMKLFNVGNRKLVLTEKAPGDSIKVFVFSCTFTTLCISGYISGFECSACFF